MLSFALLSFISAFTPGPNNSMLLQSGMAFGFRRTLPHIGGITIGFLLVFQAVRLGLVSLFTSYPIIMLGLKIIGSLYFLYIAWQMINLRPQTREPTDTSTKRKVTAKPFSFIEAVLFQWVNVKVWLFALSTNARVPPQNYLWNEITIGVLIILSSILAASTWTFLGKSLERIFSKVQYARVISAVLSLSLLYVIFTWWRGDSLS